MRDCRVAAAALTGILAVSASLCGENSPVASSNERQGHLLALRDRLRSILERGELPPLTGDDERCQALRTGRSSVQVNWRRWREYLQAYAASLRSRHDYDDLPLIARCYENPLTAPVDITQWCQETVSGLPGLATALAESTRLLQSLPAAKRCARPAIISAGAGMEKLVKATVAAAEILDRQMLRRVKPHERALMKFVLPWLCQSGGIFGDTPKKCPAYRLMWAFLPSDEFLPGSSFTQRTHTAVPPEIKSMTGLGRYLRALAGKPTSVCFLEESGRHPNFACSIDFAALQCAWGLLCEALSPEDLASLAQETAGMKPVEIKVPGISGDILAAQETPYGYIVIGGAGPNRYEDAPLLALVDIGGDDDYLFRHTEESLGLRPLQIIVDMAGDDFYDAKGVGGPGAGVLDIGVLIDRSGNDRYCQGLARSFMPRQASRQVLLQRDSDSAVNIVPFTALYADCPLDAGFAFGAGLLGIGLLVDEEGDDIYLGQKYAFGCGFWQGIGVLHDAAGNDLYVVGAAGLGTGINGAIGLLDDRSGNDHYQCLGTFESPYSVDQPWDNGYSGHGIGYGASWRVDIMASPLPTLGGGIGGVYDAEGDDVYISASFAIASGFGGGLGLVMDDAGDDVYFAKRAAEGGNYMGWSGFQSLGNGCHRGIGLLLDSKGNDVYSANAPFGGGSAWDMSMGFLIDLAGDDRFTDLHGKNEGGSLGCAATQSLAVCFNLGGKDVYERAAFGDGRDARDDYPGQGGNFAFFFDLGSEEDVYPEPNRNQRIELGPLRWNQDERGRLIPAGLALSWDGE